MDIRRLDLCCMPASAPEPDALPTLILAPGMLSDAAVWGPQAEAFGGEAQVLIADYGQARTLADMARALLAGAPARFALAAHSLGGRVAMEVARIAPERLTGLCLISAAPLPKPGGDAGAAETKARYALLGVAREQGMAAVAERFLPAILHPDSLADAALAEPVKAMVARQDPNALERQIEAGEGRPDHAEVLRGLNVPVLLICGAQDGFGRGPLQAAMAALLSDAPTLLIEHCGHLPTLEAPEAVNAAMRDWLARTRSSTLRARAPIC
jgi:pimeloyl-ACP methyl ester carboxylesterase